MNSVGTVAGIMPATRIDGAQREPLVFDLRFEYKSPPLSLNQRLHHMAKAKLTKQIREDTARLGARLPWLGRCDVTLTWYVTDKRKRDEENPVPTLKAMCDELVELGVVIDDTPEFMTKHMPRIEWIDKKVDVAHMVLRVTEVSAAPVEGVFEAMGLPPVPPFPTITPEVSE